MRAFWSGTGYRPSAGRVDRLEHSPESQRFLSDLALAEAERILAETERQGPALNQTYKGRALPDSAYDGAYETPLWAMRGGDMAHALAESLAAFIGEEK